MLIGLAAPTEKRVVQTLAGSGSGPNPFCFVSNLSFDPISLRLLDT